MPKPAASSEGRASLARPSLCLLIVLAAALALPRAASAQPEEVALIGTNPPSKASAPASSTTPFIEGRGDGTIISIVRSAAGGFPIASDVNPENVVEIYADAPCTGTPVETSTIEELEGDGIQVTAAPDSTTTFYATQTELGDPEPSECSKPLTYWHSSTPVTPPSEPPGGNPPGGGTPGVDPSAPAGPAASPPAPVLRTAPGGRANDNTPLVTGTAPGAASVRVFANNLKCSGAPVAKGSAGEFASGIELQVPDNSVTTFTAVAVSTGGQSPCSSPVSYVEDSTAPRTRITMGPGVKTRRRSAVFRFTNTGDDPPGTNFFCRVNRGKWKQCHSPFRLRHLRFKRHLVQVKAIDSAGNAETAGAKRRFKVIRAS
jgi:hypothetical protein